MSKIKVATFKAALGRVSKLVASNAVIAQFLPSGQVWLHAQQGGAHAKTLVGTLKVEPGCVPLPTKLIMGLMSGAGVTGEEDIVLKQVSRGLQLKFGGLSATLDKATVEYEIHPMDTKSEVLIGTYKGAELRDALQSVTGFSAVNDTRINLQGVALFIQSGKLVMVAMDGHRMAEMKTSWPTSVDGFGADDLVIPSVYTNALVSVIDPEKTVDVSVVGEGGSRNIRFSSEDFVLTTTLWAGRYLDYQSAMKKLGEVDSLATCDRKTVVAAIKRISLVTQIVGLKFDPEHGCIKVTSSDQESVEAVDAVFSEGAQCVEMCYDPVKLWESIAAANSEEVNLAVDSSKEAVAPIKITRKGETAWTAMLMPIRA